MECAAPSEPPTNPVPAGALRAVCQGLTEQGAPSRLLTKMRWEEATDGGQEASPEGAGQVSSIPSQRTRPGKAPPKATSSLPSPRNRDHRRLCLADP